MAVCRHAIVTCVLEHGICDHSQCMERCGKSTFDEFGFPTFSEAISFYKESNACRRRKEQVAKGVANSLSLIGIPLEASTISMTDDDFETLVAKLREAGVSDCTIDSRLSHFKSISSWKLRAVYKRNGKRLPLVDIPKIAVERKPVTMTTDEQEVILMQKFYGLRAKAIGEVKCHATTRKASRNMFVALFFQRLYAVRNGDVNRLKWGNCKLEAEGRILRYKPHKTPYKESDILIDSKTWALVAPFVGKDDEYVIERCPSDRTTHGDYVGLHNSMWHAINRMMREIGVTGCKASYVNRRRRITEAFWEGGYQASCAIGLNTPRVQDRNYIGSKKYRGVG